MSFSKKHYKNVSANLWLLDVLKDSVVANEIIDESHLFVKTLRPGLCVACKGARFLCGKTRCPIIVRANFYLKSIPLMQSDDIEGTSPPSIFVGRIGYPYVYAGPLVPPVKADTSFYDLPEHWFGKSIDEIVGFRSLLIRGKHRVHVERFEEAGKIIEATRELAFAVKPVDVELILKKKPRGYIILDDEVQPFGPSAPIKELKIGNVAWDNQIEKVHYDTDLKAAEAVLELYNRGVLVTKIQRAFSVGAFGLGKNRRLVPTRWSITAVDSIISKYLMDKIRFLPEMDEYRVYESQYLDNLFEIVMLPGKWSYESIEAWYPGTVWNPYGKSVIMYSDWEGYDGRSTYAQIGGCYYAARLAVCEHLVREQRQATVIVLREAHPGYIMPVGVWQVRENVRNAMRQKPYIFKTLEDMLKFLAGRFRIPIQKWLIKSVLLKNALFQKKITDFLKP
ncbi:MAG: Nre family DNA repair protein [Nitrososphaerota archaeon]|nr:Nre family DNA repair protein [Candidatus Bathyarchaeota archaeon]MDW8193450.1 Nre family DNA repair protein [Nitrososphaerota archaeon]